MEDRARIKRVAIYHKRDYDDKILTIIWDRGVFKRARGLPYMTVDSDENLELKARKVCEEQTGLSPSLKRIIWEYNTKDSRVHVTVFEASNVVGTMHDRFGAEYLSADEILNRENIHPRLIGLVSGIRDYKSLEGFMGHAHLMKSLQR